MNTLEFKSWYEDVATNQNTQRQIDADPLLSNAQKQAQIAATDAVSRGKDPIKASQQAVIQAKVPTNKFGLVMPKDELSAKMKKK